MSKDSPRPKIARSFRKRTQQSQNQNTSAEQQRAEYQPVRNSEKEYTAQRVQTVQAEAQSHTQLAQHNPSEPAEPQKSFKEKCLAIARRVGFHFIAVIITVSATMPLESWMTTAFYIGLICLVARNLSSKPLWVLPFSVGILQVILSFVLGLPFYVALFLGGVQTWIQRLCMLRFRMGTEWIVSVFMCYVFSELIPTVENPALTFISSGILTLLGAAFNFIYEKKRSQIQKPQVPQVPQKNTEPYADLTASINNLSQKIENLPSNIQSYIESLIPSAHNIIQCMRDDPRDREQGEKFLLRYLPATHSVLDKYIQLYFHAEKAPRTQELIQQSETILENLEQAFAAEHHALLKNDMDDFSADLNVLNTLLKMDGHKG